MTETIVALLALAPLIVGIPLLGKQLDIKHKTYDAARYSIWERSVWRSDGASNRKSEADILIEVRDRALGDPKVGVLAPEALRTQGITENPLWRERRQRMLNYRNNEAPIAVTHDDRVSPVEVGYLLVPGVAYGDGPVAAIGQPLQVDHLHLSRRGFAVSGVELAVRPVLARIADQPRTLGQRNAARAEHAPVLHRAAGALLSDSWAPGQENQMRSRVDDVTTNELIELLELPGRPIAMQALGRGEPLYGEGQYGWNPDLRPSSGHLPPAYVTRR